MQYVCSREGQAGVGLDWEGCMGGASSVITMLYWTAGGKKKEKKE